MTLLQIHPTPNHTDHDSKGNPVTTLTLTTVEFDELDTLIETLDDAEAAFNAPSADPFLKARCRDGNGSLTHLFFSEEVHLIDRAKAICSRCTLREACLERALQDGELCGVWGGELIENGRIKTNKRPRGRPPKHARPQLPVDEVPIPPHLVA
jgi:WhiB family transcriptional regulator, redox-sensing transcriptional regulator